MPRWSACLRFLTLVLISTGAPRLSAQQAGSIRGTVVDQATSAPLAGAVIRVRGTSLLAHANDLGAFVLKAVPAGDQALIVTRIGYTPVTQPVTVRAGEEAEVPVAMSPAPTSLNELVVTASKTPTEVRDVPAPVDIVSRATIEETGAKTVMEAIQNVPGVTDASYGENFQSIQLRGLPRLGNENETVLILVDGVPQTDARNSAQLTTLPVDIIDHIEVVKGPNSALYGRTAIGGVVNIITRDPTSKPSFGARLESGAYGYVRGEASAGGPIGSGGGTGYFVSWLGDRHESFQLPGAQRRESSIFGKFTSLLDAQTRLVITANYMVNNGGTPGPMPIVNGRLLSDSVPSYDRFTNLNLPYAEYNQEGAQTMARLTRDLSAKVGVTNTFGYRHNVYDFLNDGDVISPPAPGTTQVILFPFTSHRDENAYFDDLHLEANVGSDQFRQRLLDGGSFDQNTGHRHTLIPFNDSTSEGVLVDYTNPQFPGQYDLVAADLGGSIYTTTFWGFYFQDEIAVGERLHLSAGARYDINHLHAIPTAPATGGPGTATFKKLSPKIGVSYRLVDGQGAHGSQVNVYASYSQAFLPPIASIDPQVVLTSVPSPEKIQNFEAGFKGATLGGRLGFDLSAFYLKRDGIPIQVRTGGLTFAQTNGGVQKYPGIEVGLTGRATSTLWLYGKYSFYDAKFGTFKFVQNGQDVDLTGFRISLSPRHVADGGLSFEHPSGFGLNVVGHYEGSRYLDNNQIFLLQAYFTTNGRVSWRWRNYTTALSVSNIFNANYETDGDISTAQFVFPGSRRRVVAELDVNF